MAYQNPITIKDVISNIQKRNYVFPSIQREFVWKTEQIEKLFDSLMKDYPIGTFLFWKVDKDKINDFQFYEFLKKYDVRTPHNDKAYLDNTDDVVAIVDGQQRMTSIYLALDGSYTEKKKHARKTDNYSYQTKHLYLNLIAKSKDIEKEFEFKFLTYEEVAKAMENKECYWFKCSKIFELDDMEKMENFLEDSKLRDSFHYNDQEREFAPTTLQSFFNVIHQRDTVSFYLDKGEELDRVLQIFIRMNSGGTKLDHSDMLFSTAIALWREKDAREVILQFVDEINDIGGGFDFNKNIVLKSCLVLSDLPDIASKVDNFNSKNMNKIEANWEPVSSALRSTIKLISKYGCNRENFNAKRAIIPIAYFIFKNECGDQILDGGKWEGDRKAIKEWLARVILKETFGTSSEADYIYPGMRNLINANIGRFPLREIITFYRGKRKSILFSSDDIDNLLELKYTQKKTHWALTLIYPAMNHSFKDHIHPKSKFNKISMSAAGFSEVHIEEFNTKANGIANLQLLETTGSIEKNDKPFKNWLNLSYPEKSSRDRYLEQHHINPDQSLEFEDFIDFVSARRKTIKRKLTSILGATSEENDTEQ